MSMFSNLRNRTGKTYIKKFIGGGPLSSPTGQYRTEVGEDGRKYHNPNGVWELHPDSPTDEIVAQRKAANALPEELAMPESKVTTLNVTSSIGSPEPIQAFTPISPEVQRTLNEEEREDRKAERTARRIEFSNRVKDDLDYQKENGFGGKAQGTISSAINNFGNGDWKTGVTDLAVSGMKAADQIVLGDKNFGAQSEAIDSAVHGVSGALLKSGNPYAMMAGAALEGANFLTKAGGQTVQGFDVDINSSGYGDMGHMESSSSRDFGAMIGLGGLFGQDRMQAKLAKRNEQAKMAMTAANIADEQSFEQEARANSIQNTIMNNNIALAGGLDTSLLGG